MMTRKTFQAAADAIRDTRPDPPVDDDWRDLACEEIARTLADHFAADNPRFDRDKFLTATRKDS